MTFDYADKPRLISWLFLFAYLCGLTLAMYCPILHSPFGGTEYKTFLLPLKEHSLSATEYITKWSPLANYQSRFSRPLLKALLLVEHRFWGHDPLPYRLLSLLLHVGCGLAAAWVVLAATRWRLLASMVGLLLVTHPAAVPAVRWISARGDLTATFFSLLALGAVLRLRTTDKQPPACRQALLPALFVLLALTGKELGLANFIALPLVWFLWPGVRRDRKTGVTLFTSLGGVLAVTILWRLLILGKMGGYKTFPGIEEWPERLGTLLWQASGADLIPFPLLRTFYILVLVLLILFLGGLSRRRWQQIGVMALLVVVFGFQSMIAGFQDDYYAYAPAAMLCILLGIALVEHGRAHPLVTIIPIVVLLLPLIYTQFYAAALANTRKAVELEVTERLMGAIGEKERQMEDGARYLLRLEGQDRDKRIRDQSKSINIYFRYLRGPEGPAVRRNPRKLPANPPVLVWNGVDITLLPADGNAGGEQETP